MRGIAAAVLVFEALVIFFATLVALDLTDVSDRTLWWVGGVGAVLCLVVAGLLGRPGGYLAGSVLQVGLVAMGLVVPAMFFLGLLFAALWFTALILGRKVARLQAGAAAGTDPPEGGR